MKSPLDLLEDDIHLALYNLRRIGYKLGDAALEALVNTVLDWHIDRDSTAIPSNEASPMMLWLFVAQVITVLPDGDVTFDGLGGTLTWNAGDAAWIVAGDTERMCWLHS